MLHRNHFTSVLASGKEGEYLPGSEAWGRKHLTFKLWFQSLGFSSSWLVCTVTRFASLIICVSWIQTPGLHMVTVGPTRVSWSIILPSRLILFFFFFFISYLLFTNHHAKWFYKTTLLRYDKHIKSCMYLIEYHYAWLILLLSSSKFICAFSQRVSAKHLG